MHSFRQHNKFALTLQIRNQQQLQRQQYFSGFVANQSEVNHFYTNTVRTLLTVRTFAYIFFCRYLCTHVSIFTD